ncbi:MAG: DNA primase [Thermoplasmata archaeon]
MVFEFAKLFPCHALSGCVAHAFIEMRPSTLQERRDFYSHEFDTYALRRWIGDRSRHLKFAMVMGRHTGIVLESRAANKDDVVVIDTWRSVRDLRQYALSYLPESMYYDRNRYEDVSACAGCDKGRTACMRCYNFSGQQLAFDLDPENVDCPYHGHIGDKMSEGRGLSLCMYEFKRLRIQTVELVRQLSEDYSEISVVYSGRGFHVVVDDEEAYQLSRRQRERLAEMTARRFAIDEWVTSGESRLMRLPGSLNGLVSRKCVVMKGDLRDLLGFDPRTSREVIPAFMGSA